MNQQDSSAGRYLFFGLAAFGLLMASIDSTIVAVAIPALTTSLNTSLNWVGWAITGYQLMQILVMPLAGRLSDELGRKRVFMFCVGSFTLGSLLCGLAPNIGLLILFRVIQALGGGGLMPSAVGIVSDQFKERRMQAIGLFGSVFPIGGILGPNIGGWIIEHWTWREIFFVNIPIGLLVLVGTQLLLRGQQSEQDGGRKPIDLPGLALYAGGMLAFMYAMTLAGTDRSVLGSPMLWLLLAGSVALFVLFVRQERRSDHPMIEVRLLMRTPFLQANIYNFLQGICVFGLFSFIPYYAVVQYGMSSAQSGAILTPRSLAMMSLSGLSSIFILRFGYRLPMIAGTVLIGSSFGLLSLGLKQVNLGPLELDGFWLMAAEVALMGFGTGISAPASNNASIDLLPDRAAAITGLRGMFRQSGGIVGVSTTVLVLSFFPDHAAGMRTILMVFAAILLLTIPLVLMIPDSARERRSRTHQAGRVSPPVAEAVAVEGKPTSHHVLRSTEPSR